MSPVKFREKRAHGEAGGSLPVDTTLTRYGSLTLELSPVAEITKVPAAVSPV